MAVRTSRTPRSVSLLLALCIFSTADGMAFYPVADKKMPSPVKNALKKKSGAHTVSIEIVPPTDDSKVASIDAGELQEGGGAREARRMVRGERPPCAEHEDEEEYDDGNSASQAVGHGLMVLPCRYHAWTWHPCS